jgi:multiple sugar transport system ATP-binding protein
MSRVVIESLTKVFKGPRGESIRAVDNASLVVEDREFMVLVGPSGCGKSTTLRLIAGLDEPTSGAVSLDGRSLAGVPPGDRDIGMVFQNHALYPHMTVAENLSFGLKVRKLPHAEMDQRVAEAAAMLELSDCLGRLPAELSGGQRQRVAVGRVIVRKPKVLLFDEPLSNLDGPMRAQMRRELTRLHERLAATMIYVTHDQIEAMSMGDRIAIMKSGAIQQADEPMNVYRHPANLFVAGFIGSPPMNLFRGSLIANNGSLLFEEQPSAPGSAAGQGNRFTVPIDPATAAKLSAVSGRKAVLALRPEDIHAAPSAAAGTIEALVDAVEPTGPETHVHASTGSHSFVVRSRDSASLKPGGKASFTFDMSRTLLFDPETERAL